MAMLIKAICFDLDGTLIHYRDDYAALVRQMPQRLGVQDCLEDFLRLYSTEMRREGKLNFVDILHSTLQGLGRPIPGNLADFAQESIHTYMQGIELLPGALELLRYFSHLPKALITNGPADMQRAAIAKVNLEPHFQAIMVSGDADVAVRKPNPRIFEIACQRLGVLPAEALMIGDNLEADIQGAVAAGLQAIQVG